VFTATERTRIRDELIGRAEADPRIVGAALVGSAARGAEDRWSDIDLVLQLASDVDEAAVVDDWSQRLDDLASVADTHDVMASGVRYRVFLLASSLQVDISFWPRERFRATEAGFRLLFGEPGEPTEPTSPDVAHTIGMGWLYALHARSAVARGRVWQAITMLDDLRDALVVLLCERSGLNPWHGREVDLLPRSELDLLAATRAQSVDLASLDASRVALTGAFLAEIGRHDASRAGRLAAPFRQLSLPLA
jgi:predicted nucleotidyltransferase